MKILDKKTFIKTIAVGLFILYLFSTPSRNGIHNLTREKVNLAYRENDRCGDDGYLGPGECACDVVNCWNVRKHYKCENHIVKSYYERDNSCNLCNTNGNECSGSDNNYQGCNLCVVWTCPYGDTNGDGECTSADMGASHTGWQNNCSPPRCGQVDRFKNANWSAFCYTEFNNVSRCGINPPPPVTTTPTPRPTNTPTPRPTITPTNTPIPTGTPSPTSTPTPTPTPTNVPTVTLTPTPTSTLPTPTPIILTRTEYHETVKVVKVPEIREVEKVPPTKNIPSTGVETIFTLSTLISGLGGLYLRRKA